MKKKIVILLCVVAIIVLALTPAFAKKIGNKRVTGVANKFICPTPGCKAFCKPTYGEWETNNVRQADGSYAVVTMRYVRKECTKGHIHNIREYK